MTEKKLVPVEEIIYQEMEARRDADPSYNHEMKVIAAELCQEMGIPEDVIEKSYGIKLKKKEKNE